MPMTIITLSNVPNSLRGDLTKWMQEIAVGVYIGNFNTRVREQLWDRVTQNVGQGQATMSYSFRNELGYQFETHNTQRQNISYDGVPLVFIPIEDSEGSTIPSSGFSNVAKMQKLKKITKAKQKALSLTKNFVVLDIETDGLNKNSNKIIEIGAVKTVNNDLSKFSQMVKYDGVLPKDIIDLTGIDEKELQEKGLPLKDVLTSLIEFLEDLPLIGYSVGFDTGFINYNLRELGMPVLINKQFDLLRYIKKEKMFLRSYSLEHVLNEYNINEKVTHRGLGDAELTYELATKVNGFIDFLPIE